MKRSFNILKGLLVVLLIALAIPMISDFAIAGNLPELLSGTSLAILPILPAFGVDDYKPLSSLQIKERRGDIHKYLSEQLEKVKSEKREYTSEESKEYDTLSKEFRELGEKLKTVEVEEKRAAERAADEYRRNNGASDTEQWYDTRSGQQIPVYTKGQLAGGFEQRNFNIGKAVRALIVGDWKGAENEQRALSTSVGSGAVMVPISLQPQILDLIRNKALCFNAGAKLVMMPTESLSIARITGDPTIEVKAQNDAFAEATMSFDAITLKAFTIGTRIVMSRELAADAPNAAMAIQNALMQALALKLDQLALYGAGTTEPLGLLNITGTSAIDLNNGAELGYDSLIDLWTLLQNNNCDPTAYFIAPRDYANMSKERTANGYLVPPTMLQGKLVSATSIPTNLGETTDQSIVLAGDYTKMIVGLREGIQIEVSTQGDYFDRHEVGIKATMRADIAFERASQFGKIVEISAPTA